MSAESFEWFDIPAVLTRSAATFLGISQVPIRELEERDRPYIMAHLLALSPEDRRLRFSYPLGDAGLAKYLDRVDFKRDALFGVYGAEDILVGMVHLSPLYTENCPEGKPCAAELGLSIRPEARGHGLGTVLFKRALRRARNDGVERLFIYTLQDNAPMLAIARKLNMHMVNDGGQFEAHLLVKPASAYSTVTEFVDENLAEVDKLFKDSLSQLKKWADL